MYTATSIVNALFWATIVFTILASAAGIARVEIELRRQRRKHRPR